MKRTRKVDRDDNPMERPSSNGSPPQGIVGEVRRVPLEEIDLDDTGYQFRVETRVDDLKVSMRDQGQLRPVDLLGPKPPYRLIDGFRRCAVARSLGWDSVVATVHDELDDMQAFKLAFTRNVARRNLTPIDRANAVRLALRRGMTRLDVAAELGMSEKQVTRYESLLRLPAEVLAAIDGKFFTMSHALVFRDFDVGNVEEVIAEVKAKKLSATQLRKRVRSVLDGRTKTGAGGRPRLFVGTDGESVRFYGGKISLCAPQEVRERIAEQLLDMAALLQRRRVGGAAQVVPTSSPTQRDRVAADGTT